MTQRKTWVRAGSDPSAIGSHSFRAAGREGKGRKGKGRAYLPGGVVVMGPRRRERDPANGAGARPVVAARKGTEIDQGEPAEREQTELRRQQTCLPGEMGPMPDWATERRPIIAERTLWPAPSRHLLCFGSLTGDRLVNWVSFFFLPKKTTVS
jgi:hypothetical protein